MQPGLFPIPVGGVSRRFSAPRLTAFSLIELLTVMGVIAVLAALSFGSGAQALRERSLREKARADLVVVAAALESFRRHYGGYPITDRGDELLSALWGWRNARNDLLPEPGRRFLEAGGLNFSSDPANETTNLLLDPWGRPYVYAFVPGALWRPTGFLLYSCGPDGAAGPHPGGAAPGSSPEDRDNVYAHE